MSHESKPSEDITGAHRIRLHGPWESVLLSGEAIIRQARVTLPVKGCLLDDPRTTSVRLIRRLGKPTGLSPTSRVLLSLRSLSAGTRIRWNGTPLGVADLGDAPQRFEVSGRLLARNELQLEIAIPAPGPARERLAASVLLAEAGLEIV